MPCGFNPKITASKSSNLVNALVIMSFKFGDDTSYYDLSMRELQFFHLFVCWKNTVRERPRARKRKLKRGKKSKHERGD